VEKKSAPRKQAGSKPDRAKLDRLVAEATKERAARAQGYREQALKIYPWVCTRCGRQFDRSNLFELTVHHKDHDHDNNPADGSNWELLCRYCHDNEHSRYIDELAADGRVITHDVDETTTHKPFADLKKMLKADKT
jgi:5-methylcytosine-specific restriction endonuclease McrA